MTKSAVLKQNQGFLATLPVGVILAWHRDLDPEKTYIPTLPPGWVECNGQKLNDPESPFDGQDIPNLNGEGRFLRGAAVSGVLQADQMQSHTHKDSGHTHPHRTVSHHGDGPGTLEITYNQGFPPGETNSGEAKLGNPTNSGSGAGEPRHGLETRPANMSIVWIMKVKQVVSARATPVVQAADNAPLGALYVSEKGNLGIGTEKPEAKLSVVAPGAIQLRDTARSAALLISAGNLGKAVNDYLSLATIGFHSANDTSLGIRALRTSTPVSGVEWKSTAIGLGMDVDDTKHAGASLWLHGNGNVGIGKTDPQAKLDVAGDLAVQGDAQIKGSITSPMWKVTNALDMVEGGLPISRTLITKGGTLLIFASGSGYQNKNEEPIGMSIKLGSNIKGYAKGYADKENTHSTFTTNVLIVSNIDPGAYTITLEAWNSTLTNDHDYFNLTVLELPF